MAEPLTVKDVEGDHARLGEPRLVDLATVDVVLLRQDPPFDLAYVTTTHLLERIQPGTLVVNDPKSVRDAPEKLFVMDFPELMPPTLIARDRDAIEAFRAEHGEVVMKPLYGFGGGAVFKVGRAGPELRLAVRSVHDDAARTLGDPEIPAGGVARRQADHPGRRRGAGRGQPRAGRRRHPLQHGARRGGEGDRADRRARSRSARGSAPSSSAAVSSSSAST